MKDRASTMKHGTWLGRLLVSLLACTLVVVLAACSSGGSGNAASGSGSGDTQASSSADASSYKLVKDGTLTVASDLSNPPFDYYENGSSAPAGFEVELMQALAKKMGLNCEYLPPQKFDSIIPLIKQGGKADVGASNFTITDERKQEIDFTQAYIDSNQGIVTSKDLADSVAADYKAALDKKDVVIAVQSGTTGESWAKEFLPNATIKALDDPVTALTGVQSGKFTAAIADLPVMQYEVKNSFTTTSVAKEIPTGEQYGLAVSKDNPGLTAALNKALDECKSDGTLASLEDKWFGASEGSDTASGADSATATKSASETGGQSAAGGIEVSNATARPNEDGGNGVIGGVDTRLTWEGTVKDSSGVKSVTLQLPDDASFDGSSTRITVLNGLDRVKVDGKATTNGSSMTVEFSEPIATDSLLRLEITNMKFPSAGGDYTVAGTYTTQDGKTGDIPASAPISIIENTARQRIVTWLDEQDWVTAWNSVPFLNMFFKPQLLVTSFASLFPGWLVCLLIVVAAYPFAIALGLVFALLKTSRHRLFRAIASIYINLLRGTPLFLQIYIAFFGLPMVGINIDNTILGIIVVAINSSSYQAEIYRAGIESIPQGQYEAASSLGMSHMQTMFYIILPQTIRRVIPTVTSDFITSYKDTSLLSSVGVMELMMFSKNLTTTTGNITPYIAAAIYYLIVTLPLIKVVTKVERHLSDEEHGRSKRPKVSAEDPLEEGTEESAEVQQDANPIAQAMGSEPSPLEALLSPFKPQFQTDGGTGNAR